jgi:hypothetical protein
MFTKFFCDVDLDQAKNFIHLQFSMKYEWKLDFRKFVAYIIHVLTLDTIDYRRICFVVVESSKVLTPDTVNDFVSLF